MHRTGTYRYHHKGIMATFPWSYHHVRLAILATCIFPAYFLWNERRSSLLQTFAKHSHLSQCTFDSPRCFNWTGPCSQSISIYIYSPGESNGWFESLLLHQLISVLFLSKEEMYKFEQRVEFTLRSDPSLHITSNPAEACLFVPRMACLSVNKCAVPEIFASARMRQLPHWDNGRNHIILDHGDDPFAQIFSGQGAEIRMRSASSTVFHRSNFDVGLSLRPKLSAYSTVVRGGEQHASLQRPV